jgi:hypothetical protein
MSDPPSETGASDDRARLESAKIATLIGQLREINIGAPTGWVNEGWRLLAEYQDSGSLKHLGAFCHHVAGIRARMAAYVKTPQPRGHHDERCRDRKCELARRVEELAAYLFPNGKREGVNWCVGDVTGTPGKSFKICIAGEKAGLWGDFADSGKHSRNLLNLWMVARKCDFKTALREAAEWLGVRLASVTRQRTNQPPAAQHNARMISYQPTNASEQSKWRSRCETMKTCVSVSRRHEDGNLKPFAI